MTRSLPHGLTDTFLWSDDLGYGWHTREPMSYDGDYFAKYQELDNTSMGAALTLARLTLVDKFCNTCDTVDIGIGGGRFVCESGGKGFDVSAEAQRWLKDAGRYADPYAAPVTAVTCWDSLEHIPQPEKLLAQVTSWLFVSIPICETADAWRQSKHFKPAEHLWMFSTQGFVKWCERQGFELMEINHTECDLGREGITSFAFKRVL